MATPESALLKGTSLSRITYYAVTWASTGTDSPKIDLNGLTICGITYPASVVGPTLTIKTATSLAGTYGLWTDTDSNSVSIPIIASKPIQLLPQDFAGIGYVQLISSGSETSGTIFTLHLKRFL